jgi:hypothetical protein
MFKIAKFGLNTFCNAGYISIQTSRTVKLIFFYIPEGFSTTPGKQLVKGRVSHIPEQEQVQYYQNRVVSSRLSDRLSESLLKGESTINLNKAV